MVSDTIVEERVYTDNTVNNTQYLADVGVIEAALLLILIMVIAKLPNNIGSCLIAVLSEHEVS